MFNLASRALFAAAAFAIAAAVVYGNTSSDWAGVTLLVAAAAVAVLLGLTALAATGPSDRAVLVGVQGPLDGRAPQPSWMPVLVAIAAGSVVLGAALGVVAYAAGLALAAVAGLAWFVTAWREHPQFAPSMRRRVSDRVGVPFGLPLIAVVLAGVTVISVSRIFLAATKTGSVVVAGVLSLVIVVVAAVFAARPRIDRRLLAVLAVVAAVAVLTMGIVGVVVGERDFVHHGTDEVHSGVTSSGGVGSDRDDSSGSPAGEG